jgi:phage tail sheath protein FI
MAETWNHEIAQGEDMAAIVALSQPDGTFVDFTGCSFTAQVRASETASEMLAAYTCTVVDHPVTGQTNAAVKLTLDRVVTVLLPAIRLVHDLWMTDALGEKTQILKGHLTVRNRITR